MNNLDKQYTDLLQYIIDNGIQKSDRTGTGTISVFGRNIRHDMKTGFPLLTTKKMAWNSIVTELLWFLKGDTNIKFLVDKGCNVWNGDAYKHYCKKVIRDKEIVRYLKSYSTDTDGVPTIELYSKDEFIERVKTDDEFAMKWGELGPIYGKQWREWNRCCNLLCSKHQPVDQIQNLINELKTNPDSRRLMVSAWNVGEIDQMVLPPCHYGFQVYTRELSLGERDELFKKTYPGKSVDDFKPNGMEVQSIKHQLDTRYNNANIPTRTISLMWNQRSVDTFLGLPFNIASYGLLLEIIAKVVNMVPDELVGNLGDTHLYSNHIEQAKEQIGRELSEDERYELCAAQKSKMSAISEEDYIKYNIPTRTREPFPLPKLNINTEFWPTEGGECGEGPISVDGFIKGLDNDNFISCLLEEDIQLYDYQSHPAINAPLSN